MQFIVTNSPLPLQRKQKWPRSLRYQGNNTMIYSLTVTKPTTMLCSIGPFFHGQLPYHVHALSPAAWGEYLCHSGIWSPSTRCWAPSFQNICGTATETATATTAMTEFLETRPFGSQYTNVYLSIFALFCFKLFIKISLNILTHFYVVRGNRKEAARIAAEFYDFGPGQRKWNLSSSLNFMSVLKAVVRLMYWSLQWLVHYCQNKAGYALPDMLWNG